MRALLMVPVLLLAACSEEPAPKKSTSATTKLQPGQWETTTEVTRVNSTDNAEPVINPEPGTNMTASNCISEPDVAKPAPAVFSGTADECTYRNFYMSRGRINVSMSCTRPGLDGKIVMTVDGRFTENSFEGTQDMVTYLSGEGDSRIDAKITGKRVGECTAQPAAPEAAAG